MFKNKLIGKCTQNDGGEQIDAIYFDSGTTKLYYNTNIQGD